MIFYPATFSQHFSYFKDLSDEVQGDNQSKERAEKELQRLHETIAQKEGELERIKPQYEEMKRREEECTRE